MRTKAYLLAIGLSAISTSAVGRPAPAKIVLAGTIWNDYYSCHINRIEFRVDGTAEITFDDVGIMDMDEGTWTLRGANVAISYVGRGNPEFYARFAEKKLGGTYANGKLTLEHSWKDKNGNAQSETCASFKMEAAKRQPTLHRRSRHEAR